MNICIFPLLWMSNGKIDASVCTAHCSTKHNITYQPYTRTTHVQMYNTHRMDVICKCNRLVYSSFFTLNNNICLSIACWLLCMGCLSHCASRNVIARIYIVLQHFVYILLCAVCRVARRRRFVVVVFARASLQCPPFVVIPICKRLRWHWRIFSHIHYITIALFFFLLFVLSFFLFLNVAYIE